MDFSKKIMEKLGHGVYIPMDMCVLAPYILLLKIQVIQERLA
ncbi:uncharacterized protein J3R85_018679 [Psidium guajava]|nr:uncharacterized protein J3R85_018679 [Psidium guajava]